MHKQDIEIPVTFEVSFSAPDEIDRVWFNGQEITDIISPVLEVQLIDQAKALDLQDRIDRGMNYGR